MAVLPKILITPRSLTGQRHAALNTLQKAGYDLVFSAPGKQPTEEDLIQLIPDCTGYLCGIESVSERVINAATHLRVISRNGTGIDNIDLDAAKRRHIKICRAEGANARGVAELAFGLMLALARNLPFVCERLKKGAWVRSEGIELENKTLGLIGCGRIGRLVAQFALGFDMKVLSYDPFPDPSFRPSGRFEFVTLERLQSEADFISLHRPPSANHEPLVHRRSIEAMKKGVFIINTARASLIDEAAAVTALESGHLAGLATDVFFDEPPKESALLCHPKVIVTPHVGGFTKPSIARAVEVAVDNILRALSENVYGSV